MPRFLVTDDMEAAVALMVATAAFAIADVLLSEAGLFATVVMGVAVANQRVVLKRNIKGFGETLEVLIIGVLFILLGALAQIDDLVEYAGEIALIVAILVLAVSRGAQRRPQHAHRARLSLRRFRRHRRLSA